MRARFQQRCGRGRPGRQPHRSRAVVAGRTKHYSERGFTLIELVIVASIIPLIIGAIAAGLITVLNLQSSVTGRLQDTSDVQQISATFQKDVQSATSFTTQSASSPQCGSGYQLLGMQWGGGQTVVSYVSLPVVTSSGTTYSLVRQYCTLGSSSPSTTTTISFDLASTSAPTNPQLPPCFSGVGCTPTGAVQAWTSAGQESGVTFVVNEAQSKASFTLSATPRAVTPTITASIPVSPPLAPLTLLSPGCSGCSVMTINRDALVTVSVSAGGSPGAIAIASTFDNSVPVSDDAGLSATSVLTEDPTLNSIQKNGSATAPSLSNTYFASKIADPLNSVIPTPTQYPTSTSPTSCSKSGSTFTCLPGYYTADQGFGSAAANVTFTGFNTVTEFKNTLAIPPSGTLTFGPGTYIFDGSPAMSQTSSGSLTINGNGALLYFIGSGAVDFGVNSAVNLTPQSGNDGVTIWDTTASTINLSNVQSNRNKYGGIYAPSGAINASNSPTNGYTGTMSALFIIASTVTVQSRTTLIITGP